jgi:hypothetical protein
LGNKGVNLRIILKYVIHEGDVSCRLGPNEESTAVYSYVYEDSVGDAGGRGNNPFSSTKC